MMKTNDLSLNELSQRCPERLAKVYNHYLQDIPSLELKTAMEYAISNGGKRLRPLLIYATGLIFDTPWENMDVPASAIELIHTYSLIHDDLPCMDNADLRRGKPTCHKKFNEGIAVLTGDALHTLALEIMASYPASLTAESRIQMISVLTNACGPFGMAGGQALDITAMSGPSISPDLLEDIYRLKTGALFSASIELGRLASGDTDEINQRALDEFGRCLGLAFQIQDDILDMEMQTEVTGKPQGIDLINNKITYPVIHGLEPAKEKVRNLYEEALESINYLGNKAYLLRDIARYMLARNK